MAPSTALLFVLYGAALFFYACKPQNRAARRTGIASASFGTIVSLLLFLLSSLGIRPEAEHLGVRIVGTVNGAPVGHMSPLTAFCFVLAGVSFLLLLSSSSDRPRRATVAFLFASVVLLISMILTVAYSLGGPLLYGSGVIPPALTTSLAFLALGTALLLSSGQRAWPRDGLWDAASRRATYVLVLVFVLLATGIVAAGYFYFRKYQKDFRAEVEGELAAIAELKVSEIVHWRKQRLGDAAVFFNNDNFSGLVRRFLENPDDAEAQGRLRTWLGKVQAAYQYDRVFLLDAEGVERVSVPATPEPAAPQLARGASEILRSGRVAFLDFHREAPDRPIHLAVLAPILEGPDGGRALGILVLRIDPEQYLYPLLRRWPTSSRTAETLLIRRDGNDALFLNELRFQTHTALTLRSPLTNSNMTAVKAALGQEGIVEGVDYRGVPVVADVRAIPGSPWFLVARMDISEIYAPMREKLWEIIALVGVLLLGAAAGVGMLWRDQRAHFYRERYKAAEALRESEERYRRTLDSMLEGFQITGYDWRYLYVNDAAAAQARRTKEELLGHTMTETFPGIEKTDMFAALRRCMNERSPHRMENELAYPNGSKAWFELSIEPAPEGIAVLSIDITERKQAEAALGQSERTLRAIFEGARDGILAVDAETQGFVVANEAICRMLGYSRDEMLGFGVKDIHPAEDLPRVAQQLERQIRGEISLASDIPMKRKDGSVFYADVNSTPVELGGRACVVGVFRDITDRKRAERRIEHLNRVLRAIRDVNQLIIRERDQGRLIQKACDLLVKRRSYASALIVLTDEADRPTAYAQAGMGESFQPLAAKLDRGELPPCCNGARQTNGVFLISDRQATCLDCPIADAYADTEAMCMALVHEATALGYLTVAVAQGAHADGEEQSLFAEMAGDLAYALHTMMSQKAGEQAEQARQSLEAQLRQAQKMEAVGRLAGGVAHDFNNMLQTILGYSAMILDKIDPDHPFREYLEEIQKAAERSADLTRQLLAFARKQTIAPKILDLNDTIASMLKMLGRLIGEDIDLLWKPARNLWPVRMDPTQLDQILANLVVNARDAISGVGKITIETGTAEFDEAYCANHAGFMPGQYVLLAVSDNGAGMDRETLSHLFEPFFTTKPHGQGTGLGLATVYGIVKQNGGFITVYSEPGQGTTFRIYLSPHEPEMPAAAGEAREVREKPTGTETVLLVEDEKALLKLAKRLLEQLGYTVLAADTPEKAISLAEQCAEEIHLLVTDVVMPEMSGRDLWQRLRTLRPGLKCLFMSGYTANVITRHGVLEEGIHFLQKPFSMDALAQKIREALER